MKVAVISDIHGNIYALEEVLKSATKEKVEKLFVLGDVVGYYYHPDKVLKLLDDWDYELIRGNHEDILQDIISHKIQEFDIRMKYGSGHRFALEKLSNNQIEKITTAPPARRITIDNIKFALYHGAPWDNNQYLYPDSTAQLLNQCNDPDANFVLIGHSHYSFGCKTRDSILLNAGSVGQSRKNGGIADWVLIDTDNCCFQFKTTFYNTGVLIKEVEKVDPEVSYLKLILNRKSV